MKKQMNFKGRIVTTRNRTREKDTLSFYWVYEGKEVWLFSQRYSQGVHEKFRNGFRDYQFRNYRWGNNPRLDKTMDKIPVYMAYAMREAA